jgi:hypothetical protein
MIVWVYDWIYWNLYNTFYLFSDKKKVKYIKYPYYIYLFGDPSITIF